MVATYSVLVVDTVTRKSFTFLSLAEVPPAKKSKLPHRAALRDFLAALHGYNRAQP
ncbi:hypothetical protein [Coleofasciculus sp. G2-EDA-02]|uniref:hypothetical protein n=1 Tax=Coleofasciculus sp. G2-EDA-02 TaxID=3069529 RepID=UPI0032F39A96